MSEKLPNRSSEAELVLRAKAGDKRAFEELIEPCYPQAFATARGIVWNPEDAADVVQEASLKAYRAIDQFRGESRFAGWYLRIVRNTAYGEAERQMNERHAVERIIGLPEMNEDVTDDSSHPASIEIETDSIVQPLRDTLGHLAREGGEIDAELAEHPQAGHARMLTAHLRDALAGGLHDEVELLLDLADVGRLGTDTTKDQSAQWRRIVWAAAHRRAPETYPISELGADKGGGRAVALFVKAYITKFLPEPPESQAA